LPSIRKDEQENKATETGEDAIVSDTNYDCDWIVVGSGFGGSVSALRLAEKGYSVKVLECGRRYEDDELPRSTWNLKRCLWAPFVGFYGLTRITPFKDVTILSGSAVGGGSVNYASTLYRAADEFYGADEWSEMANWQAELGPHYEVAERMLGLAEQPLETEADRLIKRIARYADCEDTFQRTNVGIFFGDKEGETVSDPYFGGEGPDRTTCRFCGACMLGCQYGAKNTMRKNYLWFAEKLGVKVHDVTNVVDIRPIGGTDGSDGYEVTTQRSGALFFKHRRTFRARAISINAGALNTNRLLGRCKLNGSLPNISERIGESVRTNSETVMALSFPKESDWARCVPISSSIFPEKDSHIELVHPGSSGGGWKLFFTLLTPPGPIYAKPFLFLATAIRHPLWFLRSIWPFQWVNRSVFIMQMRSANNAIKFTFKKTFFGRVAMSTAEDPDDPLPRNFELVEGIVKKVVQEERAIPQGMVFESLLGTSVTAHILGGAAIGKDEKSGVIDSQHRVFGYENLLVCDGAAFPANPGVNPSLTITALAERAMSFIPTKGG
jgi:cholesterol oxidase